VVRAMVADYRAGLEVDRHHEAADRAAGRRVTCPTLFAFSAHDDMEELYGDPTAVWRAWVDGPLHSARIESGHHMAEEAPEQLADALTEFLCASSS
jgi:haloacetate dehalogenase